MVRSLSTAAMLFFLVSLWCQVAKAESLATPMSCLPAATALQTYAVLSTEENFAASYRLNSLRIDQIVESPVIVDVVHDAKASGKLQMKLRFEDPDLMSLPFNLYAVMVVVPGQAPDLRDYSGACTRPGIGFFPGQEVKLDAFALPLKGRGAVQIMIWGRH